MRQRASSVIPSSIAAVRIAVCAVAVAALAACAGQKPQTRAQAPASSAPTQQTTPSAPAVDPNAPVTVALLAPTTASAKGVRRAAQDLVAAAQLARSDRAPANLVMKVYDTRGDAAGAAEAAAHAVRDGAALILGPLLSGSTSAVAPVAQNAGLNVLSFSNDVSVGGGNVWVLGRTPGDELRRLFSFSGSQGVNAVAVAYPTNRYGELVASESAPAGREVGVSVGPFVGYERSFQGIESASKGGASAMRGEGVDGVLIADRGDALRSMAAFLAYYDVAPRNVRYMGLSRWMDPGNSRESALQGGWFVSVDPDASAAFDSRFSARMGRKPHALAHVGYDAVALAAAMLDDAQASGASPFVADAIARTAIADGAIGGVRLTPEGDNRRSLAILQVTEEGVDVLDPAPRIAPGS